MTETEIQTEILDFLHSLDVQAWRQQNHATPGRRNNVKKGLADISGILKNGIRLEIEVKTKEKSSKLSAEQLEFKKMIEENNGIYIIARDVLDLKNYVELFDKKHNPY
jgi:hypothetical protein